jgi:hypothetical protein
VEHGVARCVDEEDAVLAGRDVLQIVENTRRPGKGDGAIGNAPASMLRLSGGQFALLNIDPIDWPDNPAGWFLLGLARFSGSKPSTPAMSISAYC